MTNFVSDLILLIVVYFIMIFVKPLIWIVLQIPGVLICLLVFYNIELPVFIQIEYYQELTVFKIIIALIGFCLAGLITTKLYVKEAERQWLKTLK